VPAWAAADQGRACQRDGARLRLLAIANGLAVRVDPREVAFPNLGLTAHFFAEPTGEWIGFGTTVSIGPTGIGLTHSIIHDRTGPISAVSQIPTVRPGVRHHTPRSRSTAPSSPATHSGIPR